MEMLDLGRINAIAPYSVAFYDDSYHFETAGGIHIAIEFEPEHNFQYNGYWLGLLNLDRRPSLRDENISLIISKTHPQHDDIVSYFDDVVQMFKENKP